MSDWGQFQKPMVQKIPRGIPQSEIMTSRDEIQDLAMLALGAEQRATRRMLFELYPDAGPMRRELYGKHLEFFEASKTCSEVAAIAANRVGKTTMAAYASGCHSTGWYPDWWPGRKWNRPTRGWACGKSSKTTRDIIQKALFGEVIGGQGAGNKAFSGTGMIPAEWIGRATWQSGTTDYADTVRVQHVSGKWSTIGLKSYEQGRDAFEGEKMDWIWDDEEPPQDVYGEQIIRLTPTSGKHGEMGLMLGTFTPLEGLTDVVLSFWDPSQLKAA